MASRGSSRSAVRSQAVHSRAGRTRTLVGDGAAVRSRLDGGGVRVPEIQRSRLLSAAVSAVEEFGYTGVTVARITERARVSRRTFYDLFDNREQCLVAVLEEALERVTNEILAADLTDLSWSERVRGGLWTILCFFDREPVLARVCIVQSQRAGLEVLERRQEILDQLALVVEAGQAGSRRNAPGGLTGQGVVGAVWQILYARLLKPAGEPLRGLLGELMALIVLPYMGPAVARREKARPTPEPVPALNDAQITSGSPGGLAELPMRLTYRTARVLQDVAKHPGSSNRQIADRVEITDQGQVSKLLSRLHRLGLLANREDGGPAKGEANEWRLTPTGHQVTSTISTYANPTRGAQAATQAA